MTTSEVGKSSFLTYLEDVMTCSNDEKKTTPLSRPRSNMGSNEMNPTPMTSNFI